MVSMLVAQGHATDEHSPVRPPVHMQTTIRRSICDHFKLQSSLARNPCLYANRIAAASLAHSFLAYEQLRSTDLPLSRSGTLSVDKSHWAIGVVFGSQLLAMYRSWLSWPCVI